MSKLKVFDDTKASVKGLVDAGITKDKNKVDGKQQAVENQDSPKLLYFEFVASEVCLEDACSCLDNEAKTLEQEAHPALDKLTSKISTLNLESVRQMKSHLVAITEHIRDELEHLLDDDEHMEKMYFTEKLREHLENSLVFSISGQDGIDVEVLQSNMDYSCDRIRYVFRLPIGSFNIDSGHMRR
ncbi:hypothetical protein FXO38_30031 [Capsicum annuum]|uniref:Uncharacterized protein n=1 Tax=Capsicum annuum TaxID=4072 RepID=A0A2G2YJR4_CAPAN|nr:hypothetical protein FXO38_30031 [Capsicum annuum]KAF3665580.1 hypothetical protein FXO37_10971 [Capsicum annuum]PHT69974.1 hypothetical protein T459_25078 [Capsicum annuum]